MGLFDRIKSAAGGAIPVKNDLDMESNQRVTNLPASQNPSDAVRASEVPEGGAFDHIEVAALSDLPNPEGVGTPTVAYVDSEDEYYKVFQR